MSDNFYVVPNKVAPLEVVLSNKTNENNNYIEDALNELHDRVVGQGASIPESEKGQPNGVPELDSSGKIPIDQLPQEAYTRVFEVQNLSEQLGLDAVVGDICIRKDIGRTYILAQGNPNQFSNWQEIAATEIGGETAGNPPYARSFLKTDWVEGDDGNYTLQYDSNEHDQGSTNEIVAFIKTSLGEPIYSQVIIDSEGLVTVTTQTPFDGSILISNLSGNISNLNYVPYSVNSGAFNAEGKPELLTHNGNFITVVTSPSIVLVDGLSKIKDISSALVHNLNETDGNYIIFIDSVNIDDSDLNEITLVKDSEYYGIVEDLPLNGKEGQRCYRAFGGSYEHDGLGWKRKAFTPIGEVLVDQGQILKLNTYEYNQNGVITNYLSDNKDYLYGSQIEGLDIGITSNNELCVYPGKCLDSKKKKIIELSSFIYKDLNQLWTEGATAGCLQQEIDYETDTYLLCYLITDSFGNADILVVPGHNQITLPLNYKYYALLGYIPLDIQNQQIYRINKVSNFIYLEDYNVDFTGLTSEIPDTQTISIFNPFSGCTLKGMKVLISSDQDCQIQAKLRGKTVSGPGNYSGIQGIFYSNQIINSKEYIIDIPTEGCDLEYDIQGANITIKLVAYEIKEVL